MNLTITTFLVDQNVNGEQTDSFAPERFIDIQSLDSPNEYATVNPSHEIVEGAIVVRRGKETIFGLQYWDLIDSLWMTIVKGLDQVNAGKEFQEYFPDQPVLIQIKPTSDSSLEISFGSSQLQMPGNEATKLFAEAAISFFTKLSNLDPNYSTAYELDQHLTIANKLLEN